MAHLEDHGGECCGVRHIYGMDNTTVRELEDLIARVDRLDRVGRATRDSGRLIEVVLSQRQVGMDGGVGHRWAACVQAEGGWPAVMQRLGFRLVSRFNNANSGYDCFVFHRVPHFKSLADLPFAWDFDGFRTPRPGGPGRLEAAAPVGLGNVGDRVRYTYRNFPEVPYGTLGTVIEVHRSGNRYIDWDNGYRRGCHAQAMYELAPVEPVAAPVTVVATFYANVLQAGIGAFFPTVEAARAAAPRCRQQARIEISSDGTRRTVNL